MSAKHDDNAGYARDVYPDRRKVADRRDRDRDEADRRAGARLREAIRTAEVYGSIPDRGSLGAPQQKIPRRLLIDADNPRAAALAYLRLRGALGPFRFPLDPRSMNRDELVRHAYANETRR